MKQTRAQQDEINMLREAMRSIPFATLCSIFGTDLIARKDIDGPALSQLATKLSRHHWENFE